MRGVRGGGGKGDGEMRVREMVGKREVGGGRERDKRRCELGEGGSVGGFRGGGEGVTLDRVGGGGYESWGFFMYLIQRCFICSPSDSTVSEDAGIEPRTVANTALTVRRH